MAGKIPRYPKHRLCGWQFGAEIHLIHTPIFITIFTIFDNENCMKQSLATQGLANLLSCAKAALLTICLAAFKTSEF